MYDEVLQFPVHKQTFFARCTNDIGVNAQLPQRSFYADHNPAYQETIASSAFLVISHRLGCSNQSRQVNEVIIPSKTPLL